MGKLFGLLAALLCLGLLTSCTAQQKMTGVYSFSGENDSIAISGGVITMDRDWEVFHGGNLTFQGEELSDVKDSVITFYFYKDGVEQTILCHAVSVDGVSEGERISSDMGSVQAQTLYSSADWGLLRNTLHFSLTGTQMNGESFEYYIPLSVSEADSSTS